MPPAAVAAPVPVRLRLAVVALGLLFAAGAPSLAAERRAPPRGDAASDAFSCDGRHLCRQMRSCAEARFYLETCGVRSLDRDRDGVPCETICGAHR